MQVLPPATAFVTQGLSIPTGFGPLIWHTLLPLAASWFLVQGDQTVAFLASLAEPNPRFWG